MKWHCNLRSPSSVLQVRLWEAASRQAVRRRCPRCSAVRRSAIIPAAVCIAVGGPRSDLNHPPAPARGSGRLSPRPPRRRGRTGQPALPLSLPPSPATSAASAAVMLSNFTALQFHAPRRVAGQQRRFHVCPRSPGLALNAPTKGPSRLVGPASRWGWVLAGYQSMLPAL